MITKAKSTILAVAGKCNATFDEKPEDENAILVITPDEILSPYFYSYDDATAKLEDEMHEALTFSGLWFDCNAGKVHIYPDSFAG